MQLAEVVLACWSQQQALLHSCWSGNARHRPAHFPRCPLLQEEEWEQQLHEAHRTAAEAAAEAAQLQQALDARAEELAGLQAESEEQAQRMAVLDAELEAARAAAASSSTALAKGAAVERQLAQRVAALEGELSDAQSEAAAKATSCEHMGARVDELTQQVATVQAASKAKSAAIAGRSACSVALYPVGASCWHAGHAAQHTGSTVSCRLAALVPGPCPLAELKSSLVELEGQLAECTQQAAGLEEQVAEQQAKACSLTAQLCAADEALAAAKQQVHKRCRGIVYSIQGKQKRSQCWPGKRLRLKMPTQGPAVAPCHQYTFTKPSPMPAGCRPRGHHHLAGGPSGRQPGHNRGAEHPY